MTVEELHKYLEEMIILGQGSLLVLAECDHGQTPEVICTPYDGFYCMDSKETIHPDDKDDYPNVVPCIIVGG